MESAYAAAVAAFQLAEDCKNVAKISFVAGPFGTGTICVLAPGPNDVVIFDTYMVDGEGLINPRSASRTGGFSTGRTNSWETHNNNSACKEFHW